MDLKNSDSIKKDDSVNEFAGTIHVFKGARDSQRTIRTKCDFFTPNEDICVRVTREKVTFKKPTIDYNGRTYVPKSTSSGWVSFLVTAEIPFGYFDFDLEESNIDQRVAYFEQQKNEEN
jgi:hypothetical protein